MNRTFKRIFIAAIVLIVVAAGAAALVVFGGSKAPLEGARTATINTIIDTSGIKERIDAQLRSRAQDLSDATGIPSGIVEAAIDDLDIPSWQATVLPETATEQSQFDIEVEGAPVTVTTYDDDSVVTIEAYDQEVTFELPESARPYLSLLGYLDALNAGD